MVFLLMPVTKYLGLVIDRKLRWKFQVSKDHLYLITNAGGFFGLSSQLNYILPVSGPLLSQHLISL